MDLSWQYPQLHNIEMITTTLDITYAASQAWTTPLLRAKG